ncbi:MAG TPA: hypothetical protein PK014_03195 [Thermoanaerobaculia bacterium]|nr:hypothetical protein [Thermoanaerobaculia bacterium]HUM29062.1 hypothetical protein [Thermoanaerobaculia bacterium]HXK67382.1 hypothetical protein [Thermoanaerobaculia bacterium]
MGTWSFPSDGTNVIVDLTSILSLQEKSSPSWPEGLSPDLRAVFLISDSLDSHPLVSALNHRGWQVKIVPETGERDFLASIALSCIREGIPASLATADPLALQFAGPRLDIWLFPEGKRWMASDVVERWGVDPWKLPDLHALMGLPERGVPGTLGLDRDLAIKILSIFDGVEELLARLDLLEVHEFPSPHRLQKLLDQQADRILIGLERVRYDHRYNIPVDPSMFIRKRKSRIL